MAAAAASDDAQLAAVRRRLAALAYDAGGLTPAAAPLVATLLDELGRASGAYRTLQAQCSDAGKASQGSQYQVGVVRCAAACAGSEGNRGS